MSRLIHIMVITDGHSHRVNIAHSMKVAKLLAAEYYRQYPRHWNRYVQLVDSATGEVTTL